MKTPCCMKDVLLSICSQQIRGKSQRTDGHKTAMSVIYAGKATSETSLAENEFLTTKFPDFSCFFYINSLTLSPCIKIPCAGHPSGQRAPHRAKRTTQNTLFRRGSTLRTEYPGSENGSEPKRPGLIG